LGYNGIDIAGNAWTATLSITGVRFEMVKQEVALSIGGIGTVVVKNCTFLSGPEIPSNAIIQGATSLTLENNYVGRPGESWIFYDFGTGGAGKDYQFVATSNVVRGKLLHIRPDNSVIDGLTTLLDGVRGEIVWPNLVPDAVAGQGQLSGGGLRVKLAPRRNANVERHEELGGNCGLRIADCEFRGPEFEFKVGDLKSAIRNPQFELCAAS
jgi:hypothetical protein